MRPATFSQRPPSLPVTRLRVGRVVLLGVVTLAALIGGTVWLLMTKGHPLAVPTVESTAWPAWMRQAQVYPASEPKPAPAPATPPVDQTAAQLAALRAALEEQRLAIEELRKRGTYRPAPPA